MKTIKAWALFLTFAVLYAYIGNLMWWIIAAYFVLLRWLWFCRRHPLVGWFVIGFIRGLSGRRW